MVILFILLAILTLCGVRYSKFHEDYLSLSATNAVKGVFAVIILYRHMPEYMHFSDSWLDQSFVAIDSYLAQLIVAMFLFYSGYGIMLSVAKKPNYIDSFFKNRIIKILTHFDIAVLSFILLQLCLGKMYSRGEYLLSWIGWFSVGNSNWFIFDILALYLITWTVLLFHTYIKRISNTSIIFMHLLLVASLWGGLYILKPGRHWWIDTLLTYPFGMLYAVNKQRIDKFLRNTSSYFLALSALLVTFVVWHYYMWVDQYGICSCIFCMLISVLTMRFQFNNKALQWLGTYAFAIYIMQRWPMLIYVHQGWNSSSLLFVCLSIPSALSIAYLFQYLLKRLDNRFFAK